MVTINLSAVGAKEAVARLREFLAADGINLKQTHAYEALARTLGYANWNTLQALLNATPLPESDANRTATTLNNKQTARTDDKLDAEPRTSEQRRKTTASRNLEQSLHRAVRLASERRHEYATLEYLLLSLTEDQDAESVLLACHINMEQLRKELTNYIDSKLDPLVTTEPGTAKPTTAFQRVVQRAILHAQNLGGEVTSANVLVAIFTEPESHAVNILQQQGMTRNDAMNYVANARGKPLDGGQSA